MKYAYLAITLTTLTAMVFTTAVQVSARLNYRHGLRDGQR